MAKKRARLTIQDAQSVKQVIDDPAKFAAALSARYKQDRNEFYLSHEDPDFWPCLYIAVRGDAATLLYYSADGVMLQCCAKEKYATDVVMLMDGVETERPASVVIPFSGTLRAAKEFFESKAPPESIRWEEL